MISVESSHQGLNSRIYENMAESKHGPLAPTITRPLSNQIEKMGLQKVFVPIAMQYRDVQEDLSS